jgi:hypothetical protein
LAVAVVVVAVAAIWAPSAFAFSWSAPAAVDEAPPFGQGNPHDISCPTASLCVAVGMGYEPVNSAMIIVGT